MRIINTQEKNHKSELPTTKTYNVSRTYIQENKKMRLSRLVKINNKVKNIIIDKNHLKIFLNEIEIILKKKPILSMKSIIKRANKFIEKNNTLTKGNI
jgi:hypothetical protein